MQAALALDLVPKYTGQARSCHARVYITTALLLLGTLWPRCCRYSAKAWLCLWGSVAPGFPSCSTVRAVWAMAGGCGEGMGEEGCQDRWERPWPLSLATGSGPWDSLAVFGIFGLWEHSRSLCGLQVGDAVPCPQKSSAILWCLFFCMQAKPQWAALYIYQMFLVPVEVLSLKSWIHNAVLDEAALG